MKIAVYGAGAVGGYFGGRLAQSGQDVTFIARGAHLDAIRRSGLQVSSPKGDFVIHPASATDDPSTIGLVDLVLVAIKAGQISRIGPAISSMVGPKTVVVPLQNGVEAPAHLVALLGPKPIIGGLCRIVASISGAGRIVHDSIEPTVVVGELDGSTGERVSRLRVVLEAAGITVEIPDDIHSALWTKFLLVAPWGGLGALVRVTLDVLCTTSGTRRLLEQAISEVRTLAVALGVALPANIVDTTITFLAGLPPGNTASMQRDIMAGRPSELEAQTGSIVRLGRDNGVSTPVNTFIYHCLLPGEKIARQRIEPISAGSRTRNGPG